MPWCWSDHPLSWVTLSHVARQDDHGRVIYLKRRRWYAELLIVAANVGFNPPFQVLPNQLWLAWERSVYRYIYGLNITVNATGHLRLPALPGMMMASFLGSATSAQDILSALGAAIDALRQLHSCLLQFPDGRVRRFSHADATVRNVSYDVDQNVAYWFDFETIHPSSWSPAWRHADDLRAFGCSAAAGTPTELYPLIAHLIVTRYNDPVVLGALQEIADRPHWQPNLFHQAQTGLSGLKTEHWLAALRRALAT